MNIATIKIRDLVLNAIIGTQDFERERPQPIVINITMEYDASKAAESDNLNDAVDYQAVTQSVIRLVESSRFFLVEKLAAEVLNAAMADSRVVSASVTIDKPQALPMTKSVSLTLSFRRDC